ncbi:MAG: ribosome maturation factor RimP [Deltaproteobacteria bacterium]|nr:ribosome maturation factor RimP [Deltaproteobacteria bacterium]
MINNEVEQEVTKICEPLVAEMGLDIVEIRFRRETHGWVLRVLIERREGRVAVDDCSILSRELSDLIDIEDPIEGKYNLEVSSPGLDRPLTKPEDYLRFSGREVTLKTNQLVDGRKNFKGTLSGLVDDTVTIEIDGKPYQLKLADVEKANLVPVFEEKSSSTSI